MLGFAALFPPLPYLPLLALANTSGKQKTHSLDRREDLCQSHHSKTDHVPFLSILLCRSQQQSKSDVPPPSSSGSPEAPWGDYTNHTSL